MFNAELLHVLSTPLQAPCAFPRSPVPYVFPGTPVPRVSWVPVSCVSRVPSALYLPTCPMPSVFLGAQCPVPSWVSITLLPSWGPLPTGEPHPTLPTQPAPCSHFISSLSLKLLLCRPSQLIADGGRNLLRLISCFKEAPVGTGSFIISGAR